MLKERCYLSCRYSSHTLFLLVSSGNWGAQYLMIMKKIISFVFLLCISSAICPMLLIAQDKQWIGVKITQAILNEKDITLDVFNDKLLGITKLKNGDVKFAILENKTNEQCIVAISEGTLHISNYCVAKNIVVADCINATWHFDSFCGKKNGVAQMIICSDKERHPALPQEVPLNCKGFWISIKVSDDIDMTLIGIYICNSTDLEEVLK